MFGKDMSDCGPDDEQGELGGGLGQSPQRAKLLQQLIEMLSQLPDQEHKPQGGALEIDIGKPEGDPKKMLG